MVPTYRYSCQNLLSRLASFSIESTNLHQHFFFCYSDKLSVLTTPTQKKQRGKSPDTPETFRYSLDVSPTAHKSKYRVKITHRTKGATTPPSRDLPLLLAKSSPSRSQNLRPHSQISPPAPILCPNTVTNVSGWSPSDALIIALFFRSSRH